MKKILMMAAAMLAVASGAQLRAQDDPVVIEVAGQQIRQSEFMQEFMKSVGDNLVGKHGVTAFDRRQALLEYADLYATFRAKVVDARSMGLDTTADLRAELAHNRAELAAPYLVDSAKLDQLMHEAYERNRYALHASHILVRLAPDASVADTLAAYQRVQELYKRVLGGENFIDVAISEVLRANPTAQVRPDEGELNYFSSFDMVYPFENAAYALKPGEVSKPIRTRYGYHIIKLNDRVEFFGKVTLQHIWLKDASRQSDIGEAYNRLQQGTSFEMVARQSDDRTTSERGGYIIDATMGQLPQEYVKVLASLEPGEYSKPFLTRYGWHIVRLIKKDTLPPFEAMVPIYTQRMSKDPQRASASRRHFAATCRAKYGIVDHTVTPVPAKRGKSKPVEMQASLDELLGMLNDSLLAGNWRFREEQIHDLRPLVSTPDRTYNAVDMANYLVHHQKTKGLIRYAEFLRERYDDFLDSLSILYADSQLEKEHPEFAATVEEYRRGLMIFNYNDQMVWSKAIVDSAGFADFYARESSIKSLDKPADSIYFWRTRARVAVFHVPDSLCLAPAKASSLVAKGQKKDLASSAIKEQLEAKLNRKRCGSASVAFSNELVEQGRQELLADGQWQQGVYVGPEGKGYRVMAVQDILPPTLKAKDEARGYYLNEWQNELERQLADSLRKKYNVKVHWDVINNIPF